MPQWRIKCREGGASNVIRISQNITQYRIIIVSSSRITSHNFAIFSRIISGFKKEIGVVHLAVEWLTATPPPPLTCFLPCDSPHPPHRCLHKKYEKRMERAGMSDVPMVFSHRSTPIPIQTVRCVLIASTAIVPIGGHKRRIVFAQSTIPSVFVSVFGRPSSRSHHSPQMKACPLQMKTFRNTVDITSDFFLRTTFREGQWQVSRSA